MSDMSSLSHEYASSADFSRDINDAVRTLKKRFVGRRDQALEVKASDAARRLRDTIIQLLHRLGPSGAAAVASAEVSIPEDVLSRIEQIHRGDLVYFLGDLNRLVNALSNHGSLDQNDLALLDSIGEAADASASATFRKLWRR
jgi:hypothetical protein